MALATARSVVAVVLLFALAAEGKAVDRFWGFLDDVAGEGKEKSEVTTVAEILEHGGSIQVEDCGKKADVMEVARTEFYRNRLQVRAYGNLSRTVSGGIVSVRMYKSSASQGSSTGDWMKRELAWHSVPHNYEEDLCNHFGKSHSQRGCPLPAGRTELRFAVDKLPPMVLAGSYKLKIRAVDASDKQVACVRAHVEIPRGKSGELFRRVQGVNTAHRGRALESVTGDCSCGFSDPVCGDNGRTYDGLCQAHCADVDVAYAGKCVDQIVGPDGRALGGMMSTTEPDWDWDDDWSDHMMSTTKPDWDWDWDDDWSDDMDHCGCDDEMMWPVCGHDGMTYSSSCYADCLGGGVWMDGECDGEVDGAYNPTFTFTFLLWALVLLQ